VDQRAPEAQHRQCPIVTQRRRRAAKQDSLSLGAMRIVEVPANVSYSFFFLHACGSKRSRRLADSTTSGQTGLRCH